MNLRWSLGLTFLLGITMLALLLMGSQTPSEPKSQSGTNPIRNGRTDRLPTQVKSGLGDPEELIDCVDCVDKVAGSSIALPITSYTYDPLVIAIGSPEPISLTVKTNGTETSLNVDLENGDILVPAYVGDDTYEVSFTPEQILYGYTAGQGHNFFGLLDVYTGATLLGSLNLTANVLDDDVPVSTITSLDDDAQATLRVVNLLMPTTVPGAYDTDITTRFYDFFPDEYDFATVVHADSTVQNRTHSVVSNAIEGIGLPLYSNASSYGSDGRLLGINNYPVNQFFDMADFGFQHEVGHQWINFIIQPAGPHWPISTLAQGIMGMSIPGSNVGGHFPWDLVPDGNGNYTVQYNPDLEYEEAFTDVDLYLMGMLPPDEVAEAMVFENQDQADQLHVGGVLQGPVYFLGADDIADDHGIRVPNYSSSQKRFQFATIVVTRDRLLNSSELTFFDHMAARGEETEPVPFSIGRSEGVAKPFYLSTDCMGYFETEIMNPRGESLSSENQLHLYMPVILGGSGQPGCG